MPPPQPRPTPNLAAGAAVAGERRISYNKEHFDSWQTQTNLREHNLAAKYLRWMAMGQEHHCIDLPNSEIEVCGIKHALKGPQFEIDEGVVKKWCWMDLVGSLDPQSRAKVFGKSDGLVSCTFELREKLPQERVPTRLPIWDFIILRTDGTRFRLHPEYTKPKVPSSEVVLLPQSRDEGAAAVPGTFRHYRNNLGNKR